MILPHYGDPKEGRGHVATLILPRRLQQFAKAEEHHKQRCGMVAPGVKGEVERLLGQARSCLGLNGQCSVANLKRLLTYLCFN